jgi:ABC transport system ATP-binding/permease protein
MPCSGGQRKRVALAAALLEDADLLVLDEPTNHLDVDVIEWLEDELADELAGSAAARHPRPLPARPGRDPHRRGARRRDLHPPRLLRGLPRGPALREEQAQAAERKRATSRAPSSSGCGAVPRRAARRPSTGSSAPTLLARRRHTRPPELSSTCPPGASAQGRQPPQRRQVLRRTAGCCEGSTQAATRAPDGRRRPQRQRQDDAARLIAGRLEPDEGSVRSARPSTWAGTARTRPRCRRAPGCSTRSRGRARDEHRRRHAVSADQLLERFLFTRAQQKAYVEELSGGERRRLELLRVLADAPNLLLLDEPTNDLDLDTLAVLEVLPRRAGRGPSSSPATTATSSTASATTCTGSSRRRLRHHPGGWTEYRGAREPRSRPTMRRPGRRAAGRRPVQPGRGPASAATTSSASSRRSSAASPSSRPQGTSSRPSWQEVGEDYERRGLGAELTEVSAELEAAETRWLELSMIGRNERDGGPAARVGRPGDDRPRPGGRRDRRDRGHRHRRPARARSSRAPTSSCPARGGAGADGGGRQGDARRRAGSPRRSGVGPCRSPTPRRRSSRSSAEHVPEPRSRRSPATASTPTGRSCAATCPSSRRTCTTATSTCPRSRSSRRRWYPDVLEQAPRRRPGTSSATAALADIRESIAELRHYRDPLCVALDDLPGDGRLEVVGEVALDGLAHDRRARHAAAGRPLVEHGEQLLRQLDERLLPHHDHMVQYGPW